MSSLVNEVERIMQIYESITNRPATVPREMIESLGVKDALRKLLNSKDLQVVFKVLREGDRLCDSFETLVMNNPDEFSQKTFKIARWRLNNAYALVNSYGELS